MRIEEFLALLEDVRPSGDGWVGRCPAHDDNRPSLSVGLGDDDRILVNCFAGCPTEEVVAAKGLTLADLFPEQTNRSWNREERRPPRPSATPPKRRVTVAELAIDKSIDPLFLTKKLGVRQDGASVHIPYYERDRRPAARQRRRTALAAKDGSTWYPGEGSPIPYGRWRLDAARDVGELWLVEGESDCWTAWFTGVHALGVPGADMAKVLTREDLDGIQRLYVLQEPDAGGETFVRGIARRLRELNWGGEAFVVKVSNV
jgi:putative DNA primase/helicase